MNLLKNQNFQKFKKFMFLIIMIVQIKNYFYIVNIKKMVVVDIKNMKLLFQKKILF